MTGPALQLGSRRSSAVSLAAIVVLAGLTLVHIALLARTWPRGPLSSLALSPPAAWTGFCEAAFGFAVATGGFYLLRHIRGRAYLLAAAELSVGIALVALYDVLPAAQILRPRLSALSALGFLMGLGNSFALERGPIRPAAEQKEIVSAEAVAVLLCLACLNFFLLVAPSSALVPSGFEGPGPWSRSSLLVRNSDSVAIGRNLVFASLRQGLAWLVGGSLLLNNIASMCVVSLGLGFLAGGLGIVAGPWVAVLALVSAMTERWILAAAFAGNLPSTLVAASGLLFFALMRAAWPRRRGEALFSREVFLLVLAACLVAMYSYAAVRIPFVLGLVLLSVVLLVPQDGGAGRRVAAIGLTVLVPVGLTVLFVLVAGYRGRAAELRRDLLVGWPRESIRPHPGPQGLPGFSPIRDTDTPIWLQVARATDGRNVSVVWRRTPGETVHALAANVSNALKARPEPFCISSCIYFLVMAAALRAPALAPRLRMALALAGLWSVLWISAYLLVPDPDAYRRGIPFSAAFALCGAFAFASKPGRPRSALLSLALGLLLVLPRFPQELAASNGRAVRSAMFPVCENARAVRTLLIHGLETELREKPHYLVIPPGRSAGEIACLRSAVGSREWQRLIPSTQILFPAPGQLMGEVSRLPSPAVAIVYCSWETMRDNDVAALCDGTAEGMTVRATVDVRDKTEASKWVLITRNLRSGG